jgi:hypothetical protein
MESDGLERLGNVSIADVSRGDYCQAGDHHHSAASPMAPQHRQRADELEAITRDETPSVERTPMLCSMIRKELGERVAHASSVGQAASALLKGPRLTRGRR